MPLLLYPQPVCLALLLCAPSQLMLILHLSLSTLQSPGSCPLRPLLPQASGSCNPLTFLLAPISHFCAFQCGHFLLLHTTWVPAMGVLRAQESLADFSSCAHGLQLPPAARSSICRKSPVLSLGLKHAQLLCANGIYAVHLSHRSCEGNGACSAQMESSENLAVKEVSEHAQTSIFLRLITWSNVVKFFWGWQRHIPDSGVNCAAQISSS